MLGHLALMLSALYLSPFPSLRRKIGLCSEPSKCHAHWKDIFALPSSLREVQIKVHLSLQASERASWSLVSLLSRCTLGIVISDPHAP